jgi:uncharacterized protein YkwD
MSLLKFLVVSLILLVAGLAGFLGFESWQAGKLDFLVDQFEVPGQLEIVEKEVADIQEPSVNESAPRATTTAEILPLVEKIVHAPAPLPDLTPSQISGNGALTRAGVIEETNKQRQTYLGSGYDLKENALLDIAAASKAKDMLDNQYFEHISPINGKDAGDFTAAADYDYIAIGENLAKGNYANDAVLVQAWMDSPGHRENILKPGYKEMGAAVLYGTFEGKKTWLAVQIFAIPQNSCPLVDQRLGKAIDSQKEILDNSAKKQEELARQIDAEKQNIEDLKSQYNLLAADRASKDILKEKLAEINAAIAAVNQKVAEYNVGVKDARAIYDQYKSQVDQYNAQVKSFNTCLTSLE